MISNLLYNSTDLKLISLQIETNGMTHHLKTLVDSGATRSCVNSNINQINAFPSFQTSSLLRSYNGNTVEVQKIYRITFKIGHVNTTHDFLAVPNLNVDAILGLDYIESLSFNTALSKNIIKINNQPVDLVHGIIEVTCTKDEIDQFHERRLKQFGRIADFTFQSIGEVSSAQKDELFAIFRDKELSLARNPKDIGKIFKYRYTLPLFDERETAYLPPRPVPPNLLPKVEAEIRKFEEMNLIEDSESGFNIPLLILKKPDGSLRVSLDARQLNQKLIPDRFPLPSMPELLTKISHRLSSKKKGCYVTALDVNKAYWQLPIISSDQHKISFSYKNRHYKSRRMLYGLSTAPAAWSRAMMNIFGDNEKVLVYLDDILLISPSFEEHKRDLAEFLQTCIDNGLTLSMTKIKLCNQSFDFLGHHIDQEGIKPKQSHIDAIQSFQRPTSRQELKRFLGMAQFNARMVKDASVTLAPLHELTSCKRKFQWQESHENAFQKIKQDLEKSTGLAHRNLTYPLYLSTDASLTHAGATLYQKIPSGEFQAVGYFSGVFSKPETRLSSRHREIIALSRGIKHFEFHLIGTKFTAIVDHKSLLYMFREHYKCQLSNKLVNILCYLQNFDFNIVHHAGTSPLMASADFLSRQNPIPLSRLQEQSQTDDLVDKVFMISHFPMTPNSKAKNFVEKLCGGQVDTNDIVLRFDDLLITKEEMVEMQNSCNYCENIKRKLELKSKTSYQKFFLDNELLMRKTKLGPKLVLPDPRALEFISYTHSMFSHPGLKSMIRIICKVCFIPKVIDKCKLVIKNCLTCITKKIHSPMKTVLPKPKPYEILPFSKVGIDLYDLGKPDRYNKRYLFTMTDHLTSFVDGVPINSKCDQATSTAFSTLILRHGVCGQVILDNGKEFQGPIFQDLAKKFQLKLHYSSPYNSRSNARCERSHRDILVKQRVLNSNRRNWSTHWPFIQCILNNTPRESLNGLTSAECLYGRPTHYPLMFELAKNDSPKSDFKEAMNSYTNQLWPELLQLQLNRYHHMKKNNKVDELKAGDYVLTWKPKMTDGKLSTLWEGPFRIVKNYSPVSYHLVNPETGLKIRRHIRHLRPIGKIINNKLNEKYQNESGNKLENLEEGGDEGEETYTFNDLPFN